MWWPYRASSPPPPPNDALAKIRLRREPLNSVQKLNPKDVKGTLVKFHSTIFSWRRAKQGSPKIWALWKLEILPRWRNTALPIGRERTIPSFIDLAYLFAAHESSTCSVLLVLDHICWSAYLLFQPQSLLLSPFCWIINMATHPVGYLMPCYLLSPGLEGW